MNVFDLQAALTLDSSQYDKELTDSESKASKWGSAVKKGFVAAAAGTAVVGAAVVKGVGDTAKYGDEIDKMSQKLGLSTTAYQQWDYVLNIAGTEMSSMTTGLKTLTNKLDDAKNGSDSAQEMFGKLGLSMDDIQSMSREDLFGATIRSLADMEDSTDRAALANDLFGKSGQNLAPLFNMTNEEIDQLIQSTEDYGMIMSEDAVKASAAYQDSLTTLKGTMGGIKNSLLGSLLPAFTEGITKATDFVSQLKSQFREGGLAQAAQFVGQSIYDNLAGRFNAVKEALVNKFPEIQAIFDMLEETWETAKDFIDTTVESIKTIIDVALKWIKGIWEKYGESIKNTVTTIFGLIQKVIQTAMNFIKSIIKTVTAIIKGDWKGAWEGIKNIFKNAFDLIKNIGSLAMTAIKSLISAALEFIKGLFKRVLEAVKGIVSAAFSNIKEKIANIMNGIKTKISDVWNGIKTTVSNVVEGIKTKVSNVFEAVKTKVQSVWNNIKSAITKPITDAKNTVKEMIDKIKGFFNFKWELPSLKLPHFSVSGSANPLNWLKEGVPRISVDWYKKAYQNAYEFTQPTTFPLIGAGDGVGSELMVGKNYLMDTIGDTVEARVGNLAAVLDLMLTMMNQYFPQFAQMDMRIDGGALVGAIAPQMDTALGMISQRRSRG